MPTPTCPGSDSSRRCYGDPPDLLEQEEALLAEYGANAIVNAPDLELAGDASVYPLIRVGTKFPKVTEALTLTFPAMTTRHPWW